jgi:hypothetical protein
MEAVDETVRRRQLPFVVRVLAEVGPGFGIEHRLDVEHDIECQRTRYQGS